MKLSATLYSPKTMKQSDILDQYLQYIDQLRTLHGERYDPQLVGKIRFFKPVDFYYPEDEYHEYIDIDYHNTERIIIDLDGEKVVEKKYVVNPRLKNIRDKRVAPFHQLTDDWNQILNAIVKIGDRDLEQQQIIKEYNYYYNKTVVEWIHFTCRPAIDCSYETFIKQARKAFKKKWITEYTLVFEQKGKVNFDLGNGFHLHALIKIPYSKPWTDCKQEMYNTFKHIAKPGLGTLAQPIKSSTDYENVLNYFSEKNTLDKNKILSHDKEWRKKMGLKDVYKSDFI
jgi:hypothetical protein